METLCSGTSLPKQQRARNRHVRYVDPRRIWLVSSGVRGVPLQCNSQLESSLELLYFSTEAKMPTLATNTGELVSVLGRLRQVLGRRASPLTTASDEPLMGQHAADRNQDATVYVGGLDPQVCNWLTCFAPQHAFMHERCRKKLLPGSIQPLVWCRCQKSWCGSCLYKLGLLVLRALCCCLLLVILLD